MRHRLNVLLALCASTLSVSASPVALNLPDFHCTGMKESVRLPAKLSKLRAIGKLIEERTVHVEAWEGYKAIEKLLRFNGLSPRVITFTNDPERYNLSAATIESASWSVSPILIGSPVSDLQARVAGFVPKSTGAWHLAGESDSLHIQARNGKVTRVAYECYTG